VKFEAVTCGVRSAIGMPKMAMVGMWKWWIALSMLPDRVRAPWKGFIGQNGVRWMRTPFLHPLQAPPPRFPHVGLDQHKSRDKAKAKRPQGPNPPPKQQQHQNHRHRRTISSIRMKIS